MSEENVEIVRRMISAYTRGDPVSAWLDAFSPDVVTIQNNIPGARTYHGPEGVLQVLLDWTEAFDDFVMTAEQFTDVGGDKVIARIHQAARGAHSGVPVEQDFWFVFTVNSGEIRRMDMFNEEREALAAAGVRE